MVEGYSGAKYDAYISRLADEYYGCVEKNCEIKEENDADIEWAEEQYREFQQANWEEYLGI